MLLLLACAAPDEAAPPGKKPSTEDTSSTTPPEVLPDPCADAVHEPVLLNELVASNLTSFTDASGETPDWFELINAGEAPVDTTDWLLTDGSIEWALPALTLVPGAIQLVLASGEDRVDTELHASFTLSATEPYLALVGPDGCVADEAVSERLYGDVAFGRTADGWGYFLEPTPGAENLTESRPGFAPTPTLSPASGVFSGGTVGAAGEGTIRATLGGWVPQETDAEVTGPISISSEVTVVRARAWVDGLWPSRVATATYFQTLPAYDVSLLSIAMDPPDLWDEDIGIYTYGETYEPYYPYFGANFWEDWEKEAHLDLLAGDGTPMIAQDMGLSIHGGYTRAFEQKSFHLSARSAYGPDAFEGQLFPNESGVAFEDLILQLGSDFCSTNLFDAYADRLFRDDTGARLPELDMQAYAPAAVWLNGDFWGFYGLRERLDTGWVTLHYGYTDIDRVKVGWTHDANWTLEDGTWDAFDAMNSFAATADLSAPDQWDQFAAMADTDNLAANVIAVGWMANGDWWWNNLRLWRPRTTDGRFRWMMYDNGHGWPSFTYDHIATSMTYNSTGMPIGAAMQNEAFRLRLLLMAEEWMGTALSAPTATARLEETATEAAGVMPDSMARWCGTDEATWQAALDYARSYVANRSYYMRQHLITHFGLAGSVTFALDAEPAEGGRFALTFVEVDSGFSAPFFIDVPVTVTAVAQEGWAFDGWSDGEASASRTLSPTADVTLTARFVADP